MSLVLHIKAQPVVSKNAFVLHFMLEFENCLKIKFIIQRKLSTEKDTKELSEKARGNACPNDICRKIIQYHLFDGRVNVGTKQIVRGNRFCLET